MNEIGIASGPFSFTGRAPISLAKVTNYASSTPQTVSFSQWLGKTWKITKTYDLNFLTGYTFNLTSNATVPGRMFFRVNVPSGVYIYGTNASVPAFTITGGANIDPYWVDSMELNVEGNIYGKGGKGGTQSSTVSIRNGEKGGTAVYVNSPSGVKVNIKLGGSSGSPAVIAGGGGGGAAMYGSANPASYVGGGGGGGAGGGIGGGPNPVTSPANLPGQLGQPQGVNPNDRTQSGGMGGSQFPGAPSGSGFDVRAGAGGAGGQLSVAGGFNSPGGLASSQDNPGEDTTFSTFVPATSSRGGASGGGWGARGGNATFISPGLTDISTGGEGGEAVLVVNPGTTISPGSVGVIYGRVITPSRG